MTTTWHYDGRQFADALHRAGLKSGDTAFCHSNVGYFGYPKEGRTPETVFQTILDAFLSVLGSQGTLVVPTFTYSFTKGEIFAPDTTPSTVGMFTERLRLLPEARRSWDPLFSVAAIGAQARELTENVPEECFGKHSFWDRFLAAGGVICNLNFDAGSTFIHYVEKRLQVPYRLDKVFPGVFSHQGRTWQGRAVFFCRDLNDPRAEAAFEPFHRVACQRGVVRTAQVGRGAINVLSARDVVSLIETELRRDPWFLTAAHVRD